MERKIAAACARMAVMLILTSLLIVACSGDYKQKSVEGQGETKQQPVQIRVFAHQNNGRDLSDNEFSKHLEEKFNAAFQWEAVSSEGAKEKRQISLASGKYPDAYILTAYVDQFSQLDVLRYGQQGVFLPLNELIDQYAPHIKEALANNAQLRAYSVAPDGNIYGLVGYSECFHCSYPNKLWINTEWLDRLHLPMPETTEQFREVLRAFKTKDPNGNGVQDEVPLSGSIEEFGVRVIPVLMNGYIYDDDRTYLTLYEGKADLVADKEEWREGLRYIKSLFDEGLIDPGAFTQSADAFRSIGNSPEEAVLGAGAAMHPDIFVDTASDNPRGKAYNPVPPLIGPYAQNAVYIQGGITPGAKFVITNHASPEAQIALIKMVDYMYTPEGQALAEVGQEGVDWRRPAAGEKGLGSNVTPQFTRIPQAEGEPARNTGWFGMGHFYMPREYRDSWVQGQDIYAPDGYERRLYEATQLYEGKEPDELYPLWEVWIDTKDADEASTLQANLKHYIDQYALRFITGDMDLDREWGNYLAGLKQVGSERYVAIMQKAYDGREANRK
ncbi:extracellular solute-binding protein [Paenibacillus radicis (ex Gao et al. 2016)]|uniref:ABC transporter substrate-binding protein n=1 Tax=Paenibacillus radicis (ex Gao et al. 2016) TaxID=1737354 RepID=A0A917GQB0_9BACL|nr:extracellular solute-binding protein [Paenibacillus radicis (ex Gao et al. 2016)]GGG54253.1 ABC transporter substrate-binding protein [Paenibacillus radicis (ex Gao et al. 2016)]